MQKTVLNENNLEHLNRQHAHLFSALGKLREVSFDKDKAIKALENLDSLAKEHFADEERLLKESNANVGPHAAGHQEFLKMVTAYRSALISQGGTSPVLVDYMSTWLSTHIKIFDYRAFRDIDIHSN